MDKWVTWFYLEPFTLHLNRGMGCHKLSPIVLIPVPVPVPVSDTASVITPLHCTVTSLSFSGHSWSIIFVSEKRMLAGIAQRNRNIALNGD